MLLFCFFFFAFFFFSRIIFLHLHWIVEWLWLPSGNQIVAHSLPTLCQTNCSAKNVCNYRTIFMYIHDGVVRYMNRQRIHFVRLWNKFIFQGFNYKSLTNYLPDFSVAEKIEIRKRFTKQLNICANSILRKLLKILPWNCIFFFNGISKYFYYPALTQTINAVENCTKINVFFAEEKKKTRPKRSSE